MTRPDDSPFSYMMTSSAVWWVKHLVWSKWSALTRTKARYTSQRRMPSISQPCRSQPMTHYIIGGHHGVHAACSHYHR